MLSRHGARSNTLLLADHRSEKWDETNTSIYLLVTALSLVTLLVVSCELLRMATVITKPITIMSDVSGRNDLCCVRAVEAPATLLTDRRGLMFHTNAPGRGDAL